MFANFNKTQRKEEKKHSRGGKKNTVEGEKKHSKSLKPFLRQP